MSKRKTLHQKQNEYLHQWGWRRDRRGRWHKGNSLRAYTRRQALQSVGLVRQAAAKPKAGPTTSKPEKLVSRIQRYSNDTLAEMVSRQKANQGKKFLKEVASGSRKRRK